MNRTQRGRWGERVAAHFLEERGYRILEANYRCSEGEVDLVAEEGEHLVFVEVRTRTSRAFGLPEESITTAKGKRMVAVAESYLEAHQLFRPWRIDVVAIEAGAGGRLTRIEVVPNAWPLA